ncbi:MAG: hypothetical protein ACW99U_12615 [Candidatus Thorarchaeota archaeon]
MGIKLHVQMATYNTMPFLEAAIEGLAGKVDSITVVEGAWYKSAKSQRSTDGTVEYLKSCPYVDKLILFEQMPIEEYPYIQSDYHMYWLKNAENHPYQNVWAHQQQLLARDLAIRAIEDSVGEFNDDDWLFGVDSDEVYFPESLDNIRGIVEAMRDTYDVYDVCSMVFYFDFEHYAVENFRRLHKLAPGCFHSSDGGVDWEGADHTHMTIPWDVAMLFHYSYIGLERVDSKLGIWREKFITPWLEKHSGKLKGSEYSGGSVHLLENEHPNYRHYELQKYDGEHPEPMREIIEARRRK